MDAKQTKVAFTGNRINLISESMIQTDSKSQ